MLTDESPMPFGKYNGHPMSDVPANYLDWLRDQKWIKDWPEVQRYIEDNAEAIEAELRDEFADNGEWDSDD